MWTPRRIVLLALSYLAVFVGYLGYSVSALGAIDGLPALPERFRPSDEPLDIGPLLPRVRWVEEKLKQGFGPDCPELKWPIQVEMNNRSMVVAAEDFRIEEDGRVCLLPVSVLVFGKERGPGGYPEINTLRGQVAYLKFDRPVTNLSEFGGRKVVGAEISGNIQITTNRRTADVADDLVVLIGTGPLYYLESKHLIWTHDTVHLQDFQSKPKATEVWGKGMELELIAEATPLGQRPAPRGKTPTDRVTGLKRVQLQANVDMKLYVDGSSGFPGGGREEKPYDVRPPLAPPPVEKAQLWIKTPGRFQYEFQKDHDVALFEIPEADPRQPARSPHNVVLERFFESTNNRDQLYCARLELHLKKKGGDKKVGAVEKPAGEAQFIDRNLDVVYVHAQGPQVTLTSDAEKLEATGNDLIYDARIPRTTLSGTTGMSARKDRNRIRAKELQITEHKPATPGERPYQTTLALGPGQVDLLDEKNAEKILGQAFWAEKMTTTREGDSDLLVLTGAGRFVDRQNDSTLQAETLKVWITVPPARTDRESPAPPGAATPGRRIHRLEAIGNVTTTSKEVNIHDTGRLLVRFRDVPAARPEQKTPGAPALPAPVVPDMAQPATPPAAPANSVVVAVPNAPAAKPDEKPRPISLSARNVEAWVVRAGDKNSLERLWCEGSVDVKQDPAKKEEKGLSVVGDTLSMDCRPDGNIIEVTGDLAQLRMDRLYILGPVVNIDQPRNLAWVVGAGAMQVESQTNFAGDKLDKAVPMTILWKNSMLFTGATAEFSEAVQAEQESALLACSSLQVFFTRKVLLKEGTKSDEPPRVKNLICHENVRIEESTVKGEAIVKYQRLESVLVRMDALEPEDEKAAKKGGADGNEVRASGPGTLRLYQIGGADPFAQSPEPARGGAEKKPKPPEPKLTYVQYANSMYANSKQNRASFWGQVRVLNLPAKDPLREVDLEKLVADLPPEALYLACDRMTVLNRGTKEKSQQEMQASGRVLIKAREFWGRAERVGFDEAKDQVILDGGEDGTATLFKEVGRGAPPQKIQGKKITYLRSTGAFKVDEGRWIFSE